MEEKLTGIEKFFVESWEEWDQIDAFDIAFYGVVIKEGIFPENVRKEGVELSISTEYCKVTVYNEQGNIIYRGNIAGIILDEIKE